MKKVIIVPDSFKGTVSSADICAIMARVIRKYHPDCDVRSIPVADGGEGTVDSFLAAAGGEKITVTVKGPYRKDIESFYGILPNGTAVIEMAAASGLPLAEGNKQVEKATTYGVGQLILHAVHSGCRNIVVGLGGSATNDLGCGAAAGVGVVFLNKEGAPFIPVGESLDQIAAIDTTKAQEALAGISIVAMCDIDNPLCGKTGAAYVFAPQKGADNAMVEMLDEKLRSGAAAIHDCLGVQVAGMRGAGAAGGMGAGMAAFLGARLEMGIETVLDTIGFEEMIVGADLILTGEGRIDTQSLRGKVVIGVGLRAKKHGVPVLAIVGDIGDDIQAAYTMGITGIFSINRVAVPYSEARLRAKKDIYDTVDNLVHFINSIR